MAAHRVSQQGWVDFDLDVPPHQLKQYQADSGTDKIKVNPTHVQEVKSHPVEMSEFEAKLQLDYYTTADEVFLYCQILGQKTKEYR